jgi:hypothetical protein
MNEREDDDVGRLTSLGSQLALGLLADGPAHQQPKYERSLARLAFQLVDRPGRFFDPELVDTYQASLAPLYREEIERRLGATLSSSRIDTWVIIIGLIERGVAWAISVADRFWPGILDEQIQILQIYLEQGYPMGRTHPLLLASLKDCGRRPTCSPLVDSPRRLPMATTVAARPSLASGADRDIRVLAKEANCLCAVHWDDSRHKQGRWRRYVETVDVHCWWSGRRSGLASAQERRCFLFGADHTSSRSRFEGPSRRMGS